MKTLITSLALFASLNVFAQQKPQYTQYIFNQYLLNPALSGIENYLDFKAGYRKQWSGINDAPQTSFVSAHWAITSYGVMHSPAFQSKRATQWTGTIRKITCRLQLTTEWG